ADGVPKSIDGARTRIMPPCPARFRLARSADGGARRARAGALRRATGRRGGDARLRTARRSARPAAHLHAARAARARDRGAPHGGRIRLRARAGAPHRPHLLVYAELPRAPSSARDPVSGRGLTASVRPASRGRRRAAAGKSRRGKLSGAWHVPGDDGSAVRRTPAAQRPSAFAPPAFAARATACTRPTDAP